VRSSHWKYPRRQFPSIANYQRNNLSETTNRMKRAATIFLTALLLAPPAMSRAAAPLAAFP